MADEKILKAQLFQYLTLIGSSDQDAKAAAENKWQHIAKPIGGLGRFEDGITKMAGVQGTADVKLDRKAVVVFCADHGVVAEGVTQTDSSVTGVVAENMVGSLASINQISEISGADVFPVDIGMIGSHPSQDTLEPMKLYDRKVSEGTANMAVQAAMTEAQCLQAILTGVDIAMELSGQGYDMIGLGEMGIGNTTPTSAIISVLLNLPVNEVTGRGAGLSDEGLKKKIQTIERAIARYWEEATAHPIPEGPFFRSEAGLKLLAHLGGYEIAGMLGVMIGAAVSGITVMLDGYITEAAALLAFLFDEHLMDYVLASHVTAEPAGRKALKYLHLDPVIDAGMCLGEGTGASMAMGMYAMALNVYHKMPTFTDISVEDYDPENKR